MGLLDPMVILCFCNFHTVFHIGYTILLWCVSFSFLIYLNPLILFFTFNIIFQVHAQEFQFLHITTITYLFFIVVILTVMRRHLNVVLVWISLFVNDTTYLFICLLTICVSILKNVYGGHFPIFLIGFCFVLFFWC